MEVREDIMHLDFILQEKRPQKPCVGASWELLCEKVGMREENGLGKAIGKAGVATQIREDRQYYCKNLNFKIHRMQFR